MGVLQLNSLPSSSLTPPLNPNFNTHRSFRVVKNISFCRGKIRAVGTITEEESPSIDCAFISSRLLPDGSPDIAIRSASGGQKLRDIMLDCNIDLYGPYARPLLNCAGGGTCGTCIVEVVEGKELLSRRTDKEKEILRKKPKTWRLACQAMVGKEDSQGQIVIQQLPEWKAHDWEK